MDKKYPDTWCIPSNCVHSIAQGICDAVVSVYPMHDGWRKDILKTVDDFLEETSVDMNEIIAKEIEKCLKTYTNSQK